MYVCIVMYIAICTYIMQILYYVYVYIVYSDVCLLKKVMVHSHNMLCKGNNIKVATNVQPFS